MSNFCKVKKLYGLYRHFDDYLCQKRYNHVRAYIIHLNKGHVSTDFYNMIYNFF